MKTFFWKSLGIILLGMVAGCSPSASAPSGKIVIRGSNTIGEELAPRLIVEYKKSHPKAEFDLEAKGTSYGFGALVGGFCDIAAASRQPNKDELEVAQSRNVEMNDHIIGFYSIAVVVNVGNPVTNLTKEQVRDIFTGAITNWSAVGGLDAPIHLFIRDPISGTYLGFKELAMENKPYGSEQNLFTNYTGIVEVVMKDVNGIGYSSLEPATRSGVKMVSIAGVAPDPAAINKAEYPYARALHLFTGKGNETPATLDFIQFVQSESGQKALAEAGDTPIAKN
jgi:phosphate transport system substrate-binding protein